MTPWIPKMTEVPVVPKMSETGGVMDVEDESDGIVISGGFFVTIKVRKDTVKPGPCPDRNIKSDRMGSEGPPNLEDVGCTALGDRKDLNVRLRPINRYASFSASDMPLRLLICVPSLSVYQKIVFTVYNVYSDELRYFLFKCLRSCIVNRAEASRKKKKKPKDPQLAAKFLWARRDSLPPRSATDRLTALSDFNYKTAQSSANSADGKGGILLSDLNECIPAADKHIEINAFKPTKCSEINNTSATKLESILASKPVYDRCSTRDRKFCRAVRVHAALQLIKCINEFKGLWRNASVDHLDEKKIEETWEKYNKIGEHMFMKMMIEENAITEMADDLGNGRLDCNSACARQIKEDQGHAGGSGYMRCGVDRRRNRKGVKEVVMPHNHVTLLSMRCCSLLLRGKRSISTIVPPRRGTYAKVNDADIVYFERFLGKENVITKDIDEYNIDWMKWFKEYQKGQFLPSCIENDPYPDLIELSYLIEQKDNAGCTNSRRAEQLNFPLK
uniref:Uncharacterized protein n=1 Tax=Parascaris equorum TaxID=6256 RepID=A0A914S2D4_PAREQ